MYAVVKMIESSFVIVTSLKCKSSFRLKPLALLFYAIGDYVILYKLVPAAVVFSVGHLILLRNIKFSKPLKNLVVTTTISLIKPLLLFNAGLLEVGIGIGMFFYIWFVCAIMVAALSSEKNSLAHRGLVIFATVMFFVSDSTLVIKRFCVQYLSLYA